MSLDNFLSYLQQLLTMLDSSNPYSVELAKAALRETYVLAKLSGMADGITLRAMHEALERFDHFAETRDHFAGVRGEYQENQKKRKRLALMLVPGC